jgi:hypothetical protein
MRTTAEINTIKSRIKDPYKVDDFITEDEVAHLIDIFDTHQGDTIHKNTGPIVLDLGPYKQDPVLIKILSKLKDQIGNFEITAWFFFKVEYPHILHTDDKFELGDVYKGVTIPLHLDCGSIPEYPKICFFNQFYFQGPAKFFKGDRNLPEHYNTHLYDYNNIEGLTNINFDPALRMRFFTHLRPQWLDGMSLHSMIEWKPTTAIIFDSTRIHCASDFRKLNVKSKLGISIFTRKV